MMKNMNLKAICDSLIEILKKLQYSKRMMGSGTVDLTLPFDILIDEGKYDVSIDNKISKINVSYEQNLEGMENIADMKFHSTGGGSASMSSDSHGIVRITKISLEFTDLDNSVFGHEGDPLSKSYLLKKICVSYLNRLIQIVRWKTGKFWMPLVTEDAILGFTKNLSDGKRFDDGFVMDFGRTRTYPINTKNQSDVKDKINDLLKNEDPIPLDESLFLDALNYYVKGRYNEVIILINVSLEIFLQKYLFSILSKTMSNEEASKQVRKLFSDGLHRMFKGKFIQIDGRKLEEDSEMWKTFENLRDTRLYAIHAPYVTEISEGGASSNLNKALKLIRWIRKPAENSIYSYFPTVN